jgi:hypothetical protein
VRVRVALATQSADGPIDFLGVVNFGLKPVEIFSVFDKSVIYQRDNKKNISNPQKETAAQALSVSLIESRLFVFQKALQSQGQTPIPRQHIA